MSKPTPYTLKMAQKAETSRLDRAVTVELLRQHRITPTAQRIEIAAIVLGRAQHLSADEIMRLAKEGSTAVSKATVYNTLGLFARQGLVREVFADPAKVFYDSNTAPHHHFYDASAGVLMDIAPEDIEIARLPTPPADTDIEGVEVIVRIRSK